jgi:hypothetical protein
MARFWPTCKADGMLVNKILLLLTFFHSIWILTKPAENVLNDRIALVEFGSNNFSLMLVKPEVTMSQHPWVVLSDSSKGHEQPVGQYPGLSSSHFRQKPIAAQRFHQTFAS